MTKKDLVEKVAAAVGTSKKDTEAVINTTLNSIVEALADGDKVPFVGFGTFEVRERSARTGKNPKTGEAIEIPACKAPAFKAGKSFKDAVNK